MLQFLKKKLYTLHPPWGANS